MSEKHSNVDAPPAYEEANTRANLFGTTSATDDGRIEINLDSKLAKTLSAITRLPEQIDHTDEIPPPYTKVVWQTSLNIVIQVVGSRGDVQPFLALGAELQCVGHKVRIATHEVFREFVNNAGLEFFSIGGDPAELMAYMVKNPGLIPEMKTLREGEIQKKRQMIREILSGCWDSCFKPNPQTGEPFVANAIIANPPSFAHIHCAQAMGIPVHIMFTMPWSPTQSFPHPLASLRPTSVGRGMANYLSYGLVQILTWQGLADVINAFRRSLDLEPVPLTEGPFLAETLDVPHTYCWSPALVPKPGDWPTHIDVCGFFFRKAPEYKPSDALEKFLENGNPPIYIGFGSIVLDDPDAVTDIIVEAIQLCGARAIISAGWSKLGKNRLQQSNDILFLDEDCPHEWLFPRVAAVIHHGGAGTTACGLSNGRPTLVVPFFGDQFFWGDMVATAGAGPAPIRFRKLNSQNLSQGISFLLTPEAASDASTIAQGMAHENGVLSAVAFFHRNLSTEKLSCDIDPTSPAAWSYKKSGMKLKLSGRVCEILLKHKKVTLKELQPYSPKPIYIENRRWEPTTAVASSLVGTSVDLLDATNGLWKRPYDIHRQALKESDTGDVSAKTMAAMVGGSLMTIPRIYGAMAKGFLLDLPLSVAEGLRATPRLYGEDVTTLDPIVDWKSGGVVAGKTLAGNVQGAFTDLYKLPAQGLEKEGIPGLGKGVGKGVAGFLTKNASGLTGLVAYPAQGISKSIHSAFHSRTRKTIADARRSQTIVEMEKSPPSYLEEIEWLKKFEELL